MSLYDEDALDGADEADADLLDDVGGWDEYDEITCPSCGKSISEIAPQCPHCGDWVVAQGEAARRSATWFWPVVIVGLILGFLLLFVI